MEAQRVVNVTEFKAKCIAILGEVESSHTSVVVTRRGKPVAVVGPVASTKVKSLRDRFAGKGKIVGDIVNTNFDWNRSGEILER